MALMCGPGLNLSQTPKNSQPLRSSIITAVEGRSFADREGIPTRSRNVFPLGPTVGPPVNREDNPEDFPECETESREKWVVALLRTTDPPPY